MIRGKIFYKGKFIEAGIEVEDGKIKRIGKLVKGRELDGIILPAGIDVHVHFRDFRESHKETIESGSISALYGGICLVVDQPNTNPPIENFEIYEERVKKAEKESYVDYALNLALTKRNLEKINETISKISEKYFLPAVGEVFIQHNDENFQIDYGELGKVKHKLTIHAEDPKFVQKGNPNFLYRKREAEIVAIKKCLEIGNFHFCHISTKDAAEMISKSKSTFEFSPHHLLLSEEDYSRIGYLINVNPPLRKKYEVEWLLKNFCLADVLASDHAPHLVEEKKEGFSGFPGVEVMYPIFVYLASKGLISFKELVEKIAINPAKIFGFQDYGEIEEKKYANFVVFDLKKVETIRASKLHSLCGWTPYEGFKAVFPEEVYIRGEEVKKSETKLGKSLRR
ncbi:MAG: dihydroorotase [Archaeoglobaceae archaeon]